MDNYPDSAVVIHNLIRLLSLCTKEYDRNYNDTKTIINIIMTHVHTTLNVAQYDDKSTTGQKKYGNTRQTCLQTLLCIFDHTAKPTCIADQTPLSCKIVLKYKLVYRGKITNLSARHLLLLLLINHNLTLKSKNMINFTLMAAGRCWFSSKPVIKVYRYKKQQLRIYLKDSVTMWPFSQW